MESFAQPTSSTSSKDSTWFLYALPSLLSPQLLPSSHLFLLLLLSFVSLSLLAWAVSPAGPAWAHNNRTRMGPAHLRGPRGLPFIGSLLTLTRHLPHRTLARLARAHDSTDLLAFSVGSTPTVVSTDPIIAKEILTHPCFADRPLKMSARELMFGRAIGFAPNGPYWRLLRRIASTHLFSPRRIAAHEPGRQLDADVMLASIAADMASSRHVVLRPHLQAAALNNIMGSVFGRRYDVSRLVTSDPEVAELQGMVREGFDLLGAFNWSDHLPWLPHFYDPARVSARSAALVPRVRRFVKAIIDEHRVVGTGDKKRVGDNADFVDVLLSLEGEEKLGEDDMIAVLWVSIPESLLFS